jgi:hypothetical protein
VVHLVNGFLVRDDGSMISLDHIVWIELAPIVTMSPTQYDIWIHLIDGVDVKWNKEPRGEISSKAEFRKLREMIQEAIEI